MTWTSPFTAVAHAQFDAADFNLYVRDNLNETMPAKATTASQIFVSTGANVITTRSPLGASVATLESTTSGSFVELGAGPAVTLNTGANVLVYFSASMTNSVANSTVEMSVQVSGASTVAANGLWALKVSGLEAENYFRAGMNHMFTGLTPGSNTFRTMYLAGANTARFQFREINVIPL